MARDHATLALYRRLGLHREVELLLRAAEASLPEEAVWSARMELLWEQGRWGEALRRWFSEGPDRVGPDRARERVGACLWVQGRWIPALLWLTIARRRLVDERCELELLETTARVVEHMARAPGTRMLARAMARVVRRSIPPPAPALGVDMFRRTADVLSSLDEIADVRPRPSTAAGESSEWFRQVGSVGAALSFQHRMLRDSYSSDRPRDELDRDYRLLMSRVRAIGATGGANRVVLLPGAHRVFSRREFRRALDELEIAPFHRLRLSTHDLLSRLRELVT